MKEYLWDKLGLTQASFPYVIALVGSGGKTSLLGAIAQEGMNRNLKVAVLTTTHMRRPPSYHEAFTPMEPGTLKIFGRPSGREKMTYCGDECYQKLCREADLILVEADGSKRLPVKVPAGHEPVIPSNTDLILAVNGLSGLGQPGAFACHRWELAREILKLPETEAGSHLLTETDMAQLLREGYCKPLKKKYPKARFLICLNQGDTKALREQAEKILNSLGEEGMILSLKEKKNPIYEKRERKIALIYMASGFSRRFGTNKLLTLLEGKPLYQYGLTALEEAADILEQEEGIKADLLVVSQYPEIVGEAQKRGQKGICNEKSQEGITASIHLGLEGAGKAEACLFAVADQPWLKSETIVGLVCDFFNGEKGIACLSDGNRRGNPVIFSRKYDEELFGLSGDKGGSEILRRHEKDVAYVLAEASELRDVDMPGDFHRK